MDCSGRGFSNTKQLHLPSEPEGFFLDLSSNHFYRIPDSYFSIFKVKDLRQDPIFAAGRSFEKVLSEDSTENITMSNGYHPEPYGWACSGDGWGRNTPCVVSYWIWTDKNYNICSLNLFCNSSSMCYYHIWFKIKSQ